MIFQYLFTVSQSKLSTLEQSRLHDGKHVLGVVVPHTYSTIGGPPLRELPAGPRLVCLILS